MQKLFSDRLGETKTNACGELMKIVRYRSAHDVDVEFVSSGDVINCEYKAFKMGTLSNIANDPSFRLEGEEWRDAVGFEGLYQISNYGRIKNYPNRTRKGVRFLTPVISKNYYSVTLRDHSHRMVKRRVHQMVAMAFLPNPNGYVIINHKDENKLNNHVDNLEWCTPKYNVNYGTGRKRAAESCSRSTTGKSKPHLYKQVDAFDENDLFVGTFESLQEASSETGVNYKNISAVLHGKRKLAGGLVWRFHCS